MKNEDDLTEPITFNPPQISPKAIETAIFNLVISYIQMLEDRDITKADAIKSIVNYLGNLTKNLEQYERENTKNEY